MFVVDQEREDRRRINELMSMNDNIENNSLMGNFKDCRPADFQGSSLFTNSTIADAKTKKAIQGKHSDTNTLSINKTVQEKDNAKRALLERHQQHLAKVNNRKATLSHQGGNTLSMRSIGGGESHGNGIIKTIILPNEEINRLAVEQEELRQYLQAQRQVYKESIAAYEKDRLIRE